jgi:hypothetical protein
MIRTAKIIQSFGMAEKKPRAPENPWQVVEKVRLCLQASRRYLLIGTSVAYVLFVALVNLLHGHIGQSSPGRF